MRGRRLLVAVGLAALGLGAIAIAAPGFVSWASNRVLVVTVGVVTLALSVRAIQRRRHGSLEWTDPGDPERATPTPRPGDDFRRVLTEVVGRTQRTAATVHEREALGTVAVAVLTRFGSLTEDEARQRVENGTWTDDAEAAAFVGRARSLDLSLRPLLRDAIRRQSAHERGRQRTVAELARIAGVSPPNGSPDGSGDDADRTADRTADDATRIDPLRPTSSDGGAATAGDGVPSLSTGHWRGVSVVAYVGIGFGVLVQQPAVLLAGVVGVGYVAYARSANPPSTAVAVDRSLSTDSPDPDDEVTVTVTVENVGEQAIADLRFVDGVPLGLAVAEGSPRLGTALRPGETATVEYAVTARRGVHEFEPAHVIARDLATTTERERRVGPATTLTCIPPLEALSEPVPLRDRGNQLVGREAANSAGAGSEFHSTREYRHGDPLGRIDWNRRARTGELSTVEFRQERAATVVLLIDARVSAYVSPTPAPPHAVDRAVAAAGQLFERLRAGGNPVGIAAAPSESCWLAPGTDVEHAVRARKLLATHPALDPVPRERRSISSRWLRRLRRRLSPGTQIVFLTPLADADAADLARQFDERGHPVTVVSVDPTVDGSPGNRLARVTRALRCSELRSANVPVVDWAWDESLAAAVASANERGRP